MKLTRRVFIFASIGSVLLAACGKSKGVPGKIQPEPLPSGEYYAVITDIETGSPGTLTITYQVLGDGGREWFPLSLEKPHE